MISANLFRHVLDHHWFKNDALFYRFTCDDDGAAVAAAAPLQVQEEETAGEAQRQHTVRVRYTVARELSPYP
jgi:hypothetical protein